MRLLHTSDWHLGASDGERSLYDDQKHFIDAICGTIEEKKVQAVLVAGDVYDTSVGSAEALRLYNYAMTKICAGMGVPVFIIAGNHDSADRLSNLSELLDRTGLHIKGALTDDVSPLEINDVQIYLLPWITEEKVKSVFPEEKDNISSLADAYGVVTARMKKSFKDGFRHIAVSHAFIADCETSVSDRSAVIGLAAQVPASVFDGFDYVALGHLHKPQDVSGTVRYSGTPMPYSFGKEETQEKSVTIIDTDTMERETVPVPLLHLRTSFEGTLEELLNPVCTPEQKDGYVRLKVTDSYVGLEALSELRRQYPNLLEISGKSYESEDAGISITIDELEKLEEDPVEVFRYFCREYMDEEPDEHLTELFKKAIEKCEEG